MPAALIEFFSGWEKHNSLLVGAIKPLGAAQLFDALHDLAPRFADIHL